MENLFEEIHHEFSEYLSDFSRDKRDEKINEEEEDGQRFNVKNDEIEKCYPPVSEQRRQRNDLGSKDCWSREGPTHQPAQAKNAHYQECQT